MSLKKNVANQYLTFRVWNDTNDQGITGDVANISMFVGKDGGALAPSANAPTELSATNAPGWYQLQLSQAETNADSIIVVGKSTTANAEVEGQHLHTFQWSYDGVTFDSAITTLMSVLFGVAVRSGTSTAFYKRDGTTLQITVTHDTIGNRTASTF